MMKKIFLIALALISISAAATACVDAYTLKIFPIGTVDGELISIDVKVNRTTGADDPFGLGLVGKRLPEQLFTLKAFIVRRGGDQLVLECMEEAKTTSYGESYADSLSVLLKAVDARVAKLYPSIEYLTLDTLSFCLFSNKCGKLAIVEDSLLNTIHISSEDVKHQLSIKANESCDEVAESFRDYYSHEFQLGSVRRYSNSTIAITIVNTQSGETHGKNAADSATIKVNEHLTAYEEPLLYHGYGLDFILAD